MTEIRKFPPETIRVESGPIQFGDDWPGIFFRGDDALFQAGYLAEILTKMPEDFIARAVIEGLISNLRSCSVGDTGWPPS